MNTKLTKQDIFDSLAALPNVVKKSSYQLVTRCVLCGDSAKDPNKKRLGIRCDCSNPKEPILFNCFNCGESGILTADMIKDIGINDDSILQGLKGINKGILDQMGNEKINRYKNKEAIPVEIPTITKKESSLRKVKYVFDRIGTKIPIEDFKRLKIIWSIEDFLKINKIKPTNDFVWLLERDYVGFLSVNNEYIIFRDITGKNKMRYVKYNIFNIVDRTNGFYHVSNQIDLLTRDEIHIILAEGTFDILSLIYNVYHGDFENKIYVAICNGFYKNSIMHYLAKGLVGNNIYIDIYKDNDSIVNYHKFQKEIYPFTKHYHVYYNELNKDFGVPSNLISIQEEI